MSPNFELDKFEALGNDFLIGVVDAPPERLDQNYVRRICDRRFGIGADGLIISAITPGPPQSATMMLYNADGTRAEMSGNGIRCLAHALWRRGLIASPRFDIATDAGVKEVQAQGRADGDLAHIQVEMGKVSYLGAPFSIAENFGGVDYLGTELEIGNPHLVFVPFAQLEGALGGVDLDTLDLAVLGPVIEARYEHGINIEWVSLSTTPGEVDLRVWERGAGITLACGTGSTASAYLLINQGLSGPAVAVRNPGGVLVLKRDPDNETMLLVGPSSFVATISPAAQLLYES